MEKLKINYKKKLIELNYQEKILELHNQKMSLRKIADTINKRYIPRSRFRGTTISYGTIKNIIKKYTQNQNQKEKKEKNE